jgi:adenylate cyclase
MSETRKLAAILVADVVGYSRLAGADEERTLARLRGLRSDLIDPAIAAHRGRIVQRTGDGSIVEFRSVVDAVRCAIEVQNGLIERNAGVPEDRRIEFRVGVHVGDVVEESDGDLMGDGVNIAARLESVAKPGAIRLSEDAYRQVKGRGDVKACDLGATQLKNIAEPVRVYSLEVGQPADGKAIRPSEPSAPRKRTALAPLAAGIAALVILIAGGAWYFLADRPATVVSNAAAPAVAKHLSIVVLPFTNLSADPAQDYFADGITDNLTTELSRIHDSFVIARNTAFTYKGKSVDAREIGKELGVRYVLEGSVQREQNRVRVNAQLVDAASGAHLWADRFQEDLADLFKLQDQVVARLANSLGNELFKAEAQKGSRSKNPDAIDLTLRGEALMREPWGQRTKDKNDAARALFEQALKTDPSEVDALAGEADTYITENSFGWSTAENSDFLSGRRANEAKILDLVDHAIALAPNSVGPYATKAWYLQIARRWDEAIRAADAGLAINPNSAALYDARAWNENELGRFEEAKSDVQQAMRLSPRDPEMGGWRLNMGDAELGLRHFDAAIEEFHKADNSGACGECASLSLAAAYAQAGRMDEAKSALAEYRRLERPNVTDGWILQAVPGVLVEGLRKAGLRAE